MKTLKISGQLKTIMYAFVAIGLLTFIATVFTNPSRAWHAYIMNYYFFMSLGIGGVFFAGTQHLTSAGWSATVRRIPESLSAWLPWAVLLIVPIYFGAKEVYLWTDAAKVAADPVMRVKTAYLNYPFLIIRAAIFFAVWFFVGGKLVKNSLKQDETGDINLTQKNVRLSALLMPLYAITFSFISFDLIMTLDPHWYSTMFGVNCFANMFLSAIAVVIIIVIKMKQAGYFGESVNENHIQNLGLLLFAFTIFYAYITFCQYMLIWYGNLPEETSYYLRRWEGGWSCVALAIIFGKFLLPFLILLPRDAKRNAKRLLPMAYWVTAACWVDTLWMVMPDYSAKIFVPYVEIGIFLGFGGAFGLAVTGFLSRHPVQPQKDPRVNEALHLHQ